ncbi:MAG: hypothetical protein ACQGVK_22570 [Myxococcota bacterium]
MDSHPANPEKARQAGESWDGEASFSRSVAAAGQSALDRLSSFRTVYLAVVLFVLLYVFTIGALETWLASHYRNAAEAAVLVTDLDRPIADQIQSRLDEAIARSRWVRIGGARVTLHVIGRDGRLIFLNGRATLPVGGPQDPAAVLRDAERMLPATAIVDRVSIPIDSVLSSGLLILYGALLLQGLFIYNRTLARRQGAVLETTQAERDRAAERTRSIEGELERVRERLLAVEPTEKEQASEIQSLQQERESLQSKLADLAAREEELRGRAARAVELDQERQALEDLLDEAMADLDQKNDEIGSLEQSLKKASRKKGAAGGRAREADHLTRRLRTLYKNLEIDDRAVDDLLALRDETMKLKAEEAIKRLGDEADNVAVRRKVGGLPPHLSIFELGFAGKGRVYYTRGRQRRFRILTIGAKNTQKTDLEYLSRLTADDVG